MNDKQQSDVIRKIKACLARADAERNANEHERATALRQANALMEKYSIGIVDLGDTDELGPVGEDKIQVGAKPWKAMTLNAVARLYGCRVLYGYGVGYVYGRQHYRHVVADMAGYVMASIDREAKAQTGDKSFKASFRTGAASGVNQTVDTILEERAKAHDGMSQSKALVLVDHFAKEDEATRTWMVEHGHISGGTRTVKISDGAGAAAGRAYGRSINLNDQLGGSGKATQRIK